VGDIHASRCVEPWRNTKCDFSGGQRTSAELRNFEQSLQTWIDGSSQGIEAKLCKDAIFSDQRTASASANSDYFHERHQQPRLIGTSGLRCISPGKFERHACAWAPCTDNRSRADLD
jgi:hypothetical protein